MNIATGSFIFYLNIVGTSFHIHLIFTILCASKVILLGEFNFCRYASFARHPNLVNNIVSQAKQLLQNLVRFRS